MYLYYLFVEIDSLYVCHWGRLLFFVMAKQRFGNAEEVNHLCDAKQWRNHNHTA